MLTETDLTNLRDLIHFHESVAEPPRAGTEQTTAKSAHGSHVRIRPNGKHSRCEECCRSRRKQTGKKRKRSISGSKPAEAPVRSLTRRNIRERSRMSSLNQGFRRLQEHVPVINKAPKRVPKEKILRCAISYIKSLQYILAAQEESTEIPADIAQHIFPPEPITGTQISAGPDLSTAALPGNSVFGSNGLETLFQMLSKSAPEDHLDTERSENTNFGHFSAISTQPDVMSYRVKMEVGSEPEEDFLEAFDSLLETSAGDISEAEKGTIEQLERQLSVDISRAENQVAGDPGCSQESSNYRRSSSSSSSVGSFHCHEHKRSYLPSTSVEFPDGFHSEGSGYFADISNFHSEASDSTSLENEDSM